MNESFLHYLWQFQYFEKRNLLTTGGEPIEVFKTGLLNTHAGPDFTNAKIKIGEVEWAGNVEVHVKGSDWYAHQHQHDGAYNNVILHVVWENDKPVLQNDESLLPTLELKNRADEGLIKQYKKLINSSTDIACEKSLTQLDEVVKFSMLDKSLMQRLETKSKHVEECLKLNTGDWDETLYQLLARNFGFKVNAEPFFSLAKSLPYKIIQKQSQLLQVEALLFGQAGMLPTKTDEEYVSKIFQEFQFLSKKFDLQRNMLNSAQWKFMRLRPANFPTVRLAQFATLLFNTKNIFSQLISANSYSEVQQIFSSPQSEYWKTHYRFVKKAKGTVPELGEASIQNIVINTLAPVLVAYGKHKDEQIYIDRAIDLLQQIAAEQNKITRRWGEVGIKVKTAFDSQGLIELYNNFCNKRQCLNCDLGIAILKPRR